MLPSDRGRLSAPHSGAIMHVTSFVYFICAVTATCTVSSAYLYVTDGDVTLVECRSESITPSSTRGRAVEEENTVAFM